MMSGISQDVESSDTIWDQTKARLPWLIIGLFGGMLAAYMISFYEADIALFPATAMFIPVITAMGGNVGIPVSYTHLEVYKRQQVVHLHDSMQIFVGFDP